MRRTTLLFPAAVLTFMSLPLLVTVAPRAAEEPKPAEDPPGKKVFLAQKCNQCHPVSSAGIEAKVTSEKMKGADLKGVMSRHDAEWITKYLHLEIMKDGAKHKKTFTGTDDEMKALLEWLKQQAP